MVSSHFTLASTSYDYVTPGIFASTPRVLESPLSRGISSQNSANAKMAYIS